MKTLYFDCFCGASGDMIMGALIDAGADFDFIKSALGSLGVSGFEVSAEKVSKNGISATQFSVHLDADIEQPHRHLRHILEIIEKGDLPEKVKAASAETFRLIAECEAEVHGTTVEKVHFHEVGAVDSIVDIVGAHLALDNIGVERIEASKLIVGSGTVKTEHGVLPVPAPATALLLKGVPFEAGDLVGEMVTPTGAALVTQLAASFGPAPEMLVESIGYGCGTRNYEDRPNVLRVLIGESAEADFAGQQVTVIDANIDDMNPEILPTLLTDLIEKGARDAFLTPLLGKKGRPAHMITVICDEAKVQELVGVIFRGSTTLGVRMRQESRICLHRHWYTVATRWGEVRIKVGEFDGERTVASPEFEDCNKLARSAGVSVLEVYNAALAAANSGELDDA